MLLNKILVANRGEIACRIIRTCQDMGIATVAVYSDADKNAQHVQLADEAIYIGNSPAKQSYLSIENIISAAIHTSADAIHPGYGFLAENPNFAYAAIGEGITFIGPPPAAMEVMGNKRTAKIVLQDVPFVPGYFGDEQSDDVFDTEAEKIGYPVMIKAVAGGSGKGMRNVSSPETLKEALDACRREAQQNFDNDDLMLEKVIDFPRHIEIQIFGDHTGKLIALGEQECSIQRRHQKIIEESPSTMMTPELRKAMSEIAVNIGKQLGYYGAGTVEFLVDDDGNFYFMEVNARLQVEHPVTEMVTGFDLVRWQIEIARDVTLDELLPDGVTAETYIFNPNGHAIEARVYAEDPTNQFLPSTGTIALWSTPEFVRTDTGIRSGDEITIHYDPMVAKIITQGTTRLEAIRRLDYGLSKVKLLGVQNNINFLRRVLTHSDHLAGIIHTGFLEEYPDLMTDDNQLPPIALITATFAQHIISNHWRNNPNRGIQQVFEYSGQPYSVTVMPSLNSPLFDVTIGEITYEIELVSIDEENGIIIVDGHRQKVSAIEANTDEWWVHTDVGTFALRWVSPLPPPTSQQST
jgi:acetyl/propionyl-CoA carboxylase alpha subunit